MGKIITFRIDRIHHVEITNEVTVRDKDFDPSEYASKTVMMYDGGVSEQSVVIACDNQYMQNVVDKFGEEIETDIINAETFSARIIVRPNRTFFSWVFGFCGGIRIIEPPGVKEDYERLLEDVLKKQKE